MKQGKPLNEVLREIKRQSEAKQDYVAPAAALRLEEDGRTFSIGYLSDNRRETFLTTDLFHRQIGTVLNIPGKYYDRMRELKPQLLSENVNAWFADRDQNYMIRSLDYGEGPVARALLSDRYRVIDNMQIAAAVLPLFAGKPDIEVVSSAVTEEKMYIKILNKRLQTEVKPGDLVQAGVVISNSEVGLGAVSVQPLIYRLVCTNGMIVNALGERKKHIGQAVKTLDECYNLFSNETIEAEDKAFMLRLKDITKAAIEEARFNEAVNKLRESTEAKITGRIQDVVKLTASNYDLNQTEENSVLTYLINGGDLSLYGLGNAITRASQDVESYDRATALENIGWNVVSMEPAQWQKMNNMT